LGGEQVRGRPLHRFDPASINEVVPMLAEPHSASIVGVEGLPVRVEVDVAFGLPALTIVGLAGSQVQEARERVRSALRNSGFEVPARRITINLSPANRIARIVDDEDAMRQLTDGLKNAMADFGTNSMPEMNEACDLNPGAIVDPPGVGEWEREVVDGAVAEIAPAVAAMLQAAIEKRLPWSSDDR
jgi:hypothetical protein